MVCAWVDHHGEFGKHIANFRQVKQTGKIGGSGWDAPPFQGCRRCPDIRVAARQHHDLFGWRAGFDRMPNIRNQEIALGMDGIEQLHIHLCVLLGTPHGQGLVGKFPLRGFSGCCLVCDVHNCRTRAEVGRQRVAGRWTSGRGGEIVRKVGHGVGRGTSKAVDRLFGITYRKHLMAVSE